MNVGDERSRSYWMDSGPGIDAPRLDRDLECDVAIVGAGIAGLSTAYELACAGQSVIIIDRGRIGRGMTARTTAHLATELDDFYADLIDVRGEEEAKLFFESQKAAVDRIEAICREAGIEADFKRLDGYLIPTDEHPIADLERELQACRKLGVEAEYCDRAPVPGLDTGRSLRFPNQGRFHPTKYLAGLARAIRDKGGQLFADTAHVSEEEKDGRVEITTGHGPVIRAEAAVFATNSPTNNKVAIHPKQEPNRTYVIAGRVPKGSVPDVLVWDSLEKYHYVRIQELDDGEDLLIVGGEDHRSGEANDMPDRFAALADWTRRRYPSFGKTEYSWSGQVMETIDFMPFSGRNPGNGRIYIHTGDSGQGITNGVAGALAITSLILGRECRFAPVLDPGRKSASSTTAIGEFVRGQVGAVKNLAEKLGPGELGSIEELKPREGGILRRGLSKVAVYRDETGEVIERSATCTHMGCVVHWNSFERCWDCPCHGSQFAVDGQVLNGPATAPLAKVDKTDAAEAQEAEKADS